MESTSARHARERHGVTACVQSQAGGWCSSARGSPLSEPLLAPRVIRHSHVGRRSRDFVRPEKRMSDDLSNKGPADRSRINVNEDYELKYWAKALAASELEIREAVKAVGPSAEKVRALLESKRQAGVRAAAPDATAKNHQHRRDPEASGIHNRPAVGMQHLAADIGGLLTGQKDVAWRHLVGLAGASHRRSLAM